MEKRHKLTADAIVRSAMEMIDQEGADGFSMRKLAARLNVDPMALYHHHTNKAALIHKVLSEVMDAFATPAPTGDWRRDLRALCDELRVLAHRHPGCFRLYELYKDWVMGELRIKEAFHTTFIDAGFDPKSAVRGTRLLVAYIEAYVVDEIDGWLGVEDQEELAALLEQGSFPVTTALIDEIAKPDHDADFAFGLDVLIDGLAMALQNSDHAS